MSQIRKDLEELLAVPEQPVPQGGGRFDFDYSKGEGVLVTPPAPAGNETNFDEALRVLGYDPAHYQVDHHGVRVSTWQVMTKDGPELMRAVRARVIARNPAVAGFDSEKLIAEIAKHRPPKRAPQTVSGGGCMVVCVSDTQCGKWEPAGVAGLVERFTAAIDAVEFRVRELRKCGRPLNSLLIACLGDLVEGCDSHYATQTFSVMLDRREQTRVMRRLLLKAVERWARLFPEVTIAAVAGNHGEHRSAAKGGKAFTDAGRDNDDLAVPEQVMEILQANPDTYGHVKGAIGGDPYTRVVEVGGHIVGMLHGHMARESGPASVKIQRWFERQAAARAPIGAADVVLSGHYHHVFINESNGAVTFVQAPSMDFQSEWYAATKGAGTIPNPGMLTFCLYPDQKRIADLSIM